MVGVQAGVTVTVKVALAVLPFASVAVQLTVVRPTGNTLPDWGPLHVTCTLPVGDAVQVVGGGAGGVPHDEQLVALSST